MRGTKYEVRSTTDASTLLPPAAGLRQREREECAGPVPSEAGRRRATLRESACGERALTTSGKAATTSRGRHDSLRTGWRYSITP
ncbi:MAG: hypothetical protein E6I03_11520 [Chloroflexi bacterium]|nr:MAG: hypothetical protein E6I03_11520 [Chloroflexota bacterium]